MRSSYTGNPRLIQALNGMRSCSTIAVFETVAVDMLWLRLLRVSWRDLPMSTLILPLGDGREYQDASLKFAS
jgi:hypothetical protein